MVEAWSDANYPSPAPKPSQPQPPDSIFIHLLQCLSLAIQCGVI